MSDRIKCLVLTKDAAGKVELVAELEWAEAEALANKMAMAGEPAGGQVEMFSPDTGAVFFDDGSMKAYADAVEADRKKAAADAKKAEAAEKADRVAALKAELAELEGKKATPAKAPSKKKE